MQIRLQANPMTATLKISSELHYRLKMALKPGQKLSELVTRFLERGLSEPQTKRKTK
jgi:hypothetical protein